jgi:hypothetical protein
MIVFRTVRIVAFALAGAVVLTACPAENKPTTGTTAQPATQPSGTVPATQPVKTSTGASLRGTTPQQRDEVDPDGVVRRGEKLSSAQPMTVDELLANVSTLNGKTVKVTGRVEKVCKHKGCWFVVAGSKPEAQISVTAKGYGFFMPRDSVGKVATLEGPLTVKTLSAEEAQHYEDDYAHASGQPAKKVTAPKTEVGIEAFAVEMISATS